MLVDVSEKTMTTKALQTTRVLAFIAFGIAAICLTRFPKHAFLVAGLALLPLAVISVTTIAIRQRPGFERKQTWFEKTYQGKKDR